MLRLLIAGALLSIAAIILLLELRAIRNPKPEPEDWDSAFARLIHMRKAGL